MILGNEHLNCGSSCSSPSFPSRSSRPVSQRRGSAEFSLLWTLWTKRSQCLGRRVSQKWTAKVGQVFLMKNRRLHSCSQQLQCFCFCPIQTPRTKCELVHTEVRACLSTAHSFHALSSPVNPAGRCCVVQCGVYCLKTAAAMLLETLLSLT